MRSVLEQLNPQQREAVLYNSGGALILAGAGTGKTRVLTSKIIYLLSEQNVPPAEILAVTFTNKAAQEMKNRIGAALTTSPRALLLGTFHSICHRLLRIHAATAGLDKNFQILDASDQKTFIRRLLREREVSEERFPLSDVRGYITQAKEVGFRANAVPVSNAQQEQLAQIYRWYEETCRAENKVDFAELILAVIELFRANDDLRRHYAQRFRYILIDEFQDTSRQQFDWLKLLDSGDNHFFAVGDDDQSIYAFRGAEPYIMQEFQTELRADKVIRLEANYRSMKNILEAANRLISGNKFRFGKTLTTDAGGGELVSIISSPSDILEAKLVAQLAQHAISEGTAAGDMAVLYRTNAQGRLFEREMMEYGVPYRVYGGLRFYDRQEVKHALAYLRLLQTDDRDSLLRVLNMPPRGIGKKTIEDLHAGGNLFAALEESDNKKVMAFRQLLHRLRQQQGTLAELVKAVLEESGLLAHYEEKKEQERAENLRELVNAAAQFEENRIQNQPAEETAESTLSAFLSTAALDAGGEGAADANTGGGGQAVSLMTVHAAKGLEFERVFIVGMEEGLFPHALSLKSTEPRDIEEERRLMYVAITRARQQLSLHYAHERMLYGSRSTNPVSRFLSELPPECVEILS